MTEIKKKRKNIAYQAEKEWGRGGGELAHSQFYFQLCKGCVSIERTATYAINARAYLPLTTAPITALTCQ